MTNVLAGKWVNSRGANIICHSRSRRQHGQRIYYSELSRAALNDAPAVGPPALTLDVRPSRSVVRYQRRCRRCHKTRKGPTVSAASCDNPVPSSSSFPARRRYVFAAPCCLRRPICTKIKFPRATLELSAALLSREKCSYIVAAVAYDDGAPRH